MRKALSILGLMAGFVIAAQPAIAEVWGPESTYYKNIKRATGEGNFFNQGNVRAVNEIKVTDEASDGNSVYGVTRFYFRYTKCEQNYNPYAPGRDCTDDFRRDSERNTAEFKGGFRTFSHRANLAPTGGRARAETFACVQMGWPVPDGCAAPAYPSFDY